MSDFPQIFTFYSFKGGVGRSMAVLNVAYGLAARGRNVLVLDMDLEAPGLSGFLRRHKEIEGFADGDMVDLARWAKESPVAGQQASAPLDPASFPPMSDFVVGVPTEKLGPLQRRYGEQGRVDVIPVDEERDYYGRLTALGMGGFDQESLVRVGSVLRSWLKRGRCPLEVPDYYGPKAPRSAPYDYVLVDSRTGVTEIGGLCIGPLSEQLVVFTALNDQNVEGTRRFLEEVGILAQRSSTNPDEGEDAPPRRLDPKPTLIVASPVPAGEIATKRDRVEQLQKSVGQVAVKLSYHPQMALLESVFVRDFPDEYLAQEYDALIDQVLKLARDGTDFDFAQAAADLKSGLLGNRREIAQRAIRRGPGMLLPLLLLFFDLKTITDEEDFIIVDRLCRKLTTPTQRVSFSVTGPFFWADALTEWSLRSASPEVAALRRAAAMQKYGEVLDKEDASTKQKAKALFSRGVAHGRLGDSERAIVDYTAVLDLPDAPAELKALALFNRGVMYGEQGDSAREIADYTAVVDMPDAPVEQKARALVNRGVTFIEQGDSERAIADYTAVVDMPDAPAEQKANALVNRGNRYSEQGDLDGAIADYAAVVDMPDAPAEPRALALVNRAVMYGEQGDSERTIADYTAVVDMPDAPTQQKADAHSGRGWEYFVAGRSTDAIADHRQAISFDQELCTDRSSLAIALLVDGQTEEALVTYDTVLAMANLEDLADMANDLNEAVQKHGPITGADDILARIESRRAELES